MSIHINLHLLKMYSQIVLLLLLPLMGACEKASCRAARTCCDGKDAACMVPAASSNSNNIYDDYDDDYSSGRDEREAVEPCYCDHGCLEVGDCCPDYKDYCGGTYMIY